MTMGIYDAAAKKSAAHRTLGVAETAGTDYRLIDLGVHSLSPQMYIWVAPPQASRRRQGRLCGSRALDTRKTLREHGLDWGCVDKIGGRVEVQAAPG